MGKTVPIWFPDDSEAQRFESAAAIAGKSVSAYLLERLRASANPSASVPELVLKLDAILDAVDQRPSLTAASTQIGQNAEYWLYWSYVFLRMTGNPAKVKEVDQQLGDKKP